MDYQKEIQKLEAYIPGGDFWKAESGQHHVKALGELEDADPYEEEGKEPQPRMKLKILVDGKEVDWTFGVGKTKASTYGQLCNLAANKNNKLEGEQFTVVVKNDGKKNDYTIVV